jgi:hypothetical protein
MKIRLTLALGWLFGVALALSAGQAMPTAHAERHLQTATPVRRINAPYINNANPPIPRRAISWFGRVNPTDNYSDVRVIYNNDALYVTLHVIDRVLWYDSTPSAAELPQWDGATLLLHTAGNTGTAPTTASYQFVAGLNHSQARSSYQAAYRGNGTAWAGASTAFETTTGWRGDGINNGASAKGWTVTFRIPFASLGLTSTQVTNRVWGMGVVLHDRDVQTGAPVPTQNWPGTVNAAQPATWGQLRFGTPTYTPPNTSSRTTVTIRHGLNGATVSDAHVGGHTDCGARNQASNYFNGWGDNNYARYEQVNVQNQSDISDWPCFSKFYVTFPLNQIPAGKVIVSATLTMYQFGNSDPAQAPPSTIQVLTVGQDWDENTITWNNAPLAVENVASSRVDPLTQFPGWPGAARTWDVSLAAASAYGASSPLRLVLYSADGAYHTGKYFSSSDAPSWNQAARPTLQIVWGNPSGGAAAGETDLLFLPVVAEETQSVPSDAPLVETVGETMEPAEEAPTEATE